MFCGSLSLVTPIQGAIGTIAGLCNNPKFNTRIQEVVVPKFMFKLKFALPGPLKCIKLKSPFPPILRRLPGGMRESYVVEFGPIGKHFTQLSFYVSTVASCISIGMAAISYMTADMYEVNVRANWENLKVDMPDFTMDEAIGRVKSSVGGLGDSAMGLLTVLGGGLYAAAMDMGGMNWLVTNVVRVSRL